MFTGASARTRKRLLWAGSAAGILILGLVIAGTVIARKIEPFIRDEAIAFLEEKFDCAVSLDSIKVKLTIKSPIDLVFRKGRGGRVHVSGRKIVLHLKGDTNRPPLLAMKQFTFDVDLGSISEQPVLIPRIRLEGLELNIPPRGERPARPGEPKYAAAEGSAPSVLIEEILADGTILRMLPKDPTRQPLEFDIKRLLLKDAGPGVPMRYDAELINPKPPGLIRCKGTFGPWTAGAAETPISGNYIFENADLGVFKGIAGLLASTGSFHGELQEIVVDGETRVPDFRLAGVGNRVPLETHFHAIVDGTNGNTTLDPVDAKLGQTTFTVRGSVARNKDEVGKTTDLKVSMPKGRLEDALKLAMKGAKPFLAGRIVLNTRVIVPPGRVPVADKLLLEGSFQLPEAHFTSTAVQQKLDDLSRRAQGKVNEETIAEVPTRMEGKFLMESGVIRFSDLGFQIPGAKLKLDGSYDGNTEALDFQGKVWIDARLSQMMKTGWKRVALKPVDPFLAKEGYGVVSNVFITGTADNPKFSR
jgi:hypothetical protein